MAQLTIRHTALLVPEQFVAALTDFSDGRRHVWPNSQPEYLIIHESGDTWSEVTEGSGVFGGAWERTRYDWSNVLHITVKTVDSNIWTDESGWVYKLVVNDDATTTITASITRYPRSAKARLLLVFVGTIGRPLLKKQFRNTIKTIEEKYRAP